MNSPTFLSLDMMSQVNRSCFIIAIKLKQIHAELLQTLETRQPVFTAFPVNPDGPRDGQ